MVIYSSIFTVKEEKEKKHFILLHVLEEGENDILCLGWYKDGYNQLDSFYMCMYT